jgi:hypothetical protein
VHTALTIGIAVLIVIGWLVMHRQLRRRARKDDR